MGHLDACWGIGMLPDIGVLVGALGCCMEQWDAAWNIGMLVGTFGCLFWYWDACWVIGMLVGALGCMLGHWMLVGTLG